MEVKQEKSKFEKRRIYDQPRPIASIGNQVLEPKSPDHAELVGAFFMDGLLH